MISTPIDCAGIRELLPHRPPFLFVDRVIEIEEGDRIVAELDLRSDEPHFSGHFPGRPIMPGVLVTEALAQTSGLLIALSAVASGDDTRARLYYLAKADMKWTEPALPGETLILEARHQRTFGQLIAFRVRASTKRKNVASGGLTLARVDSSS